MKQKVISASNVEDLNKDMKTLLDQGWTAIGAHKVITVQSRSVVSGVGRTTYTTCEYSQTMVHKDA